MKDYTRDQMEDCFYENKQRKKSIGTSFERKVTVKSFTQIDGRYIVVETDKSDYRFITVDMEKGNTVSQVSDNRDYQILLTLGLKYEGLNSDFAYYATKMLDI